MNPWLETIGIILIAGLGVVTAKLCSRSQKPYWIIAYIFSMAIILMLAITRYAHSLAFVNPFPWITAGRTKFVLFSLAATIGLTAPMSRLPHKFEKIIVTILMVIVVTWFSIMPFLTPALIKKHLASLDTLVNADGICFQTTDYTCAPAAAVTALKKLGFSAHEGQIAITAHTNPVAGTLPECLNDALKKLYGPKGLHCDYRYFDSIEQLKNAGLTLAAVKAKFLSDHCVAVLDVSDNTVTIADPVWGKTLLSHDQFRKIWRFSGIVLNRDSSLNI
ncbi:MAG: cysteine peptidase family C39 domain-containing protein [Planctomycetota bacterium]